MKSKEEVFKQVLVDLGFSDLKPSDLTNSDYWMISLEAMDRWEKLIQWDRVAKNSISRMKMRGRAREIKII